MMKKAFHRECGATKGVQVRTHDEQSEDGSQDPQIVFRYSFFRGSRYLRGVIRAIRQAPRQFLVE